MPTRFERDTAVRRRDDRTFDATVDRAWWVQNGPNGGYVAGIILRALIAVVDDPTRTPRSLTIHYTAPPAEGDIAIATTIERAGRSMTTCAARVTQRERLIALALAAFSTPREGPEFNDLVPPAAPAPDTIPLLPIPDEAPMIAHRWETRFVIGKPFGVPTEPGAIAETGGWIRPEEPQIVDAPTVAAMTDAWIPPIFSRLSEPIIVPTVDLTVHFRTTLPIAGRASDEYLLAVFRTNAAADGFLEEDGELWTADGTLVAHSRQLAVVQRLDPS